MRRQPRRPAGGGRRLAVAWREDAARKPIPLPSTAAASSPPAAPEGPGGAGGAASASSFVSSASASGKRGEAVVVAVASASVGHGAATAKSRSPSRRTTTRPVLGPESRCFRSTPQAVSHLCERGVAATAFGAFS